MPSTDPPQGEGHDQDNADEPGNRRRRWRISSTIGAALITAAVTIVTQIPDDPPPPAPPPAIPYLSYVSTNKAEADQGPPNVIRSITSPPGSFEYKAEETLGYGLPLSTAPPDGTHTVYDLFCTGSGETAPCGGVLRSHYYTAVEKPLAPWPKAKDSQKKTDPIAVFYDLKLDGSCSRGQRPVFRFEKLLPNSPQLYDVGTTNPGDGWATTENLGCVIAPR